MVGVDRADTPTLFLYRVLASTNSEDKAKVAQDSVMKIEASQNLRECIYKSEYCYALVEQYITLFFHTVIVTLLKYEYTSNVCEELTLKTETNTSLRISFYISEQCCVLALRHVLYNGFKDIWQRWFVSFVLNGKKDAFPPLNKIPFLISFGSHI